MENTAGRERKWRAFDWISFPSPSYGLSMAHGHNPIRFPAVPTKSLVKVIPGTRLFSKSNCWLRTFHGSSSINSAASVRLSELLVEEIVLRGAYKALFYFVDAAARRCRLWLDLTFFGCWNIVSCDFDNRYFCPRDYPLPNLGKKRRLLDIIYNFMLTNRGWIGDAWISISEFVMSCSFSSFSQVKKPGFSRSCFCKSKKRGDF